MNKAQLKRLIETEVKRALNERGSQEQLAMHVAQRALNSGDVEVLKTALLRLMKTMADLDPKLKHYLPKEEKPKPIDTPLGPIHQSL